MNSHTERQPRAPWAGTLEERFRHEFLADVAAGPKDYEALVLFTAKKGEGVYSCTDRALSQGRRPYLTDDFLRDVTTDLAMDVLRAFGEGTKGPLALVTTYRVSDGDLQLRYYTGAEAKHYTYTPTTIASLAEEVSPL